MALTREELDRALEMMASPVQGQAQAGARPPMFGMVKLSDLKALREKTDEVVRAELALYDVKKKEAIQKQLAQIEQNKLKMEAELAKLA